MNRTWLVLAAFGAAMLSGWSMVAQAADVRRVNFAAFERVQDGFRFDPVVGGSFSEFITAMKGAKILLLVHTDQAVDGDVINIQQDVLRDAEGADLYDFGINCSLSFHARDEDGEPFYTLGGVCRFLGVGEKHQKLVATFKETPLVDAAQGVDAWVLLHEDKTSGIAFYANVSR
ncbi:MAG: hypothetical protein R8K47_04805 [Mariprofundaceae bacterium]